MGDNNTFIFDKSQNAALFPKNVIIFVNKGCDLIQPDTNEKMITMLNYYVRKLSGLVTGYVLDSNGAANQTEQIELEVREVGKAAILNAFEEAIRELTNQDKISHGIGPFHLTFVEPSDDHADVLDAWECTELFFVESVCARTATRDLNQTSLENVVYSLTMRPKSGSGFLYGPEVRERAKSRLKEMMALGSCSSES